MNKKREVNSYLNKLADCVRKERRRLKMTQIKFYREVMKDSVSSDENIKKKMNAIEMAKIEWINFKFFDNFCRYCDVSADYLFGYQTKYKNHEEELIHNYTGLSKNAIEMLHAYKKCLDNEKNEIIKIGFFEDETNEEKATQMVIDKQRAKIFLSIINHLFEKKKSKKGKFNGLHILNYLFKMCMGKIKRVSANIIPDIEEGDMYQYDNKWFNKRIESAKIDQNEPIILEDDNDVYHLIDLQEVYQIKAKEKLISAIDQFVEEFNNKHSSSNII